MNWLRCDNPSERVNHQCCARDLKIGLDSLSTSTHAQEIQTFCVDGIERHFRNVQIIAAWMPFLHLWIHFFRLPCCGLYRSWAEKKYCIYSTATLLFSPTPFDVHVLKNRIINGSSFSSSLFFFCSHFFGVGFVLRSFLSVVWVFRIGEHVCQLCHQATLHMCIH